MYDSRPTFAEIDLSALHHNFRTIRSSIPPRTEILAVVKADAYGHGFMDICRELENLDVDAFGVAFLAEGIQLRKAGIDRPILLLGASIRGRSANASATTFRPPFSLLNRPRRSIRLPTNFSARPGSISRSIPAWDVSAFPMPTCPPF